MTINQCGSMLRSWFHIFLCLLILQVKAERSSDTVLFSCSFVKNTCGMENQGGARAHWQRENLSKGGRTGYAMVTRGNDANNHFARLLTPFIPTQNANVGCVRFKYYIEGRTPASIALIKQGYVTQYLFASARKTGQTWVKMAIPVKFLGNQVMFYFESDTRTQDIGSSLVAFTDLIITSNSCT